eukprot:1900648-Alexandrium_andersonii.AAC.1
MSGPGGRSDRGCSQPTSHHGRARPLRSSTTCTPVWPTSAHARSLDPSLAPSPSSSALAASL